MDFFVTIMLSPPVTKIDHAYSSSDPEKRYIIIYFKDNGVTFGFCHIQLKHICDYMTI